MTLFAIIAVCSVPLGACRLAEDTTGPHATRADCDARLLEMRRAAPLLAREVGPGPYRLWAVCDELPAIRRVVPDAFLSHAQGVAL